MNKFTKQLIGVIVLLLLCTIGGSIYYFFIAENITQVIFEVTLDYNEKAQRNSAYYFEGIKENFDFDEELFLFDEIKDYDVSLEVNGESYHVTFHVVDRTAPEIKFKLTTLDLYDKTTLDDLIEIYDKSEYTYEFDTTLESLSVGTSEVCVTAIDVYGNENSLCETIEVIDTKPVLNLYEPIDFNFDYVNTPLTSLIAQYKQMRGLTDEIAISYYNFETGETYFDNPDQYMVAGSTYKLPLNMLIYEKRNAGELSGEDEFLYREESFEEGGPIGDHKKPGDYISLNELQYYSIVYSDNTASRILFDGIGGWESYRNQIQKYGPGLSYPIDFYSNQFTVRYMNEVLKYLYKNEASFPELIERLKGVSPNDYLKTYVDVPIAQKDGVYELARNAAGIVYADKPYATAVYVALGDYGRVIMGEVNLILYNYTMAH